MSTKQMNIATLPNGERVLFEVADGDTFNAAQPRPVRAQTVTVLDVSGVLYVLHPEHTEPVEAWDEAAGLALAESIDAEIAALSPEAREKLAPEWEPVATKLAKREASVVEAVGR
jgi:hypothetical protein